MSPEEAAEKPSPSLRAVLWRWRLVLAAAAAWLVTMGLYALVVGAVFSGLRVTQPESMGWLTIAAEAAACGVSLAVWGLFVYVAASALGARFGSICLASGSLSRSNLNCRRRNAAVATLLSWLGSSGLSR